MTSAAASRHGHPAPGQQPNGCRKSLPLLDGWSGTSTTAGSWLPGASERAGWDLEAGNSVGQLSGTAQAGCFTFQASFLGLLMQSLPRNKVGERELWALSPLSIGWFLYEMGMTSAPSVPFSLHLTFSTRTDGNWTHVTGIGPEDQLWNGRQLFPVRLLSPSAMELGRLPGPVSVAQQLARVFLNITPRTCQTRHRYSRDRRGVSCTSLSSPASVQVPSAGSGLDEPRGHVLP